MTNKNGLNVCAGEKTQEERGERNKDDNKNNKVSSHFRWLLDTLNHIISRLERRNILMHVETD